MLTLTPKLGKCTAGMQDTLNAAIKSAVQDKLNAAPGYGQQLMTQLTHAHPAQHQDANNSSARQGSKNVCAECSCTFRQLVKHRLVQARILSVADPGMVNARLQIAAQSAAMAVSHGAW